MTYLSEETAVVVASMMVVGMWAARWVEMNVGRKFHCSIWAAIRSVWNWAILGNREFVAGEVREALHTEAFDLVSYGFCTGLGLLHASYHLREDAANHVATLCVLGFGIDGDGVHGVECELLNVNLLLLEIGYQGIAYFAIGGLDDLDLDIINLDHLAIQAHNRHQHGDDGVVHFKFLFLILHAVA